MRELFDPAHSVISVANSLPEPALVCQRAAIQSREAQGTASRAQCCRQRYTHKENLKALLVRK